MLKMILPMLLIFAVGCSRSATNAPDLRNEDNIREVVFRHQFDHNASGQQKKVGVYCLSITRNDTDPSDEFMKRFADHSPPVRKASKCQRDRFKGVIDRRTGKPGLIFRVTEMTWISAEEVEVEGGYYEAALSASGNTYTVTKQQGKWQVTSDKMNFISQRVRPIPPIAVAKSELPLSTM